MCPWRSFVVHLIDLYMGISFPLYRNDWTVQLRLCYTSIGGGKKKVKMSRNCRWITEFCSDGSCIFACGYFIRLFSLSKPQRHRNSLRDSLMDKERIKPVLTAMHFIVFSISMALDIVRQWIFLYPIRWMNEEATTEIKMMIYSDEWIWWRIINKKSVLVVCLPFFNRMCWHFV